jgi:Carboxypeptidase regulatory-like domain
MYPRLLKALVILTLLGSPAFAQEQRGSIEGTVKDSSGAVLPGVTVEAHSNTGAVLTTVSDTAGVFRFTSVPPGTYEITAALEGFAPGKVPNVIVGLGQIKKVDFALALQGVQETVQVTAESPLVDVKQSARGTNIRAEQIELLPKGRDFLTLATQAPGTNNEPKSGGIMVDGATAGENRYIIDGTETTDLVHGTSGKTLIADFLEEVQVKSSGYTAEYGGSTGGVINVITKSGTNRFSGNGLLYWQGSSVSGNSDTLRTKLDDPLQAEYVRYPKDDTNRFEPGFSIGGPIVRDRQWFWGAYQPALTEIDRTVDPSSSLNPSALSISQTQKTQFQYLSANHTAQIGDKLRTRIAYNNSWSKTKGLLPSLNGTDPGDGIDINYLKTSTFPSWTLSGHADYMASRTVVFGFHAGYFLNDQHDSDVPNVSRYLWTTTSNVNFVGTNGVPVPANLQHGTNFTSVISNTAVDHDKLTRQTYQADVTWFARAGGEHQIKGGVQFDRRENDVFSGELGHRVTFRWGTPLTGSRIAGTPNTGPFGYYSIRSAVDTRVDPSRYGGAAAADSLRKFGFVTTGNVSSNLTGLFIQDAWSVNNRLTINLGLRTEQEDVPIYGAVPGITAAPIKFNFADKLAPRVGFAYDVTGDGRNKVYGSWGIYYDIFKLGLPRGSFGGDKWIEYYYTLDTPNWTSVDLAAGCPPACSGTLMRVTDFRLPTYSTSIADCSGSAGCTDPDLKPMRSQEFSFGFERQFGNVWAGAIRYVHKQLDRGIEDIGGVDAAGNEVYVIGNPGEGQATIAYSDDGSDYGDNGITVNWPKPKRDYDGVEITLEKRFANRWFMRGSYLWSRLNGNFPGLSQTDENGRTDPNVGRLYDFPMIMFLGNGQPNYGRLPTDRPHQVKLQFVYQLPFGTSIGVNQAIQSGIPITSEIGVFPTSNFPVQWLGRGNAGRTDVFTQTDLSLTHSIRVGPRTVDLIFNVLNLFNQDNVINNFITYARINGVTPDEGAFFRGQVDLASLMPAVPVPSSVSGTGGVDPRYLQANGFQTPIQARFGVRFTF